MTNEQITDLLKSTQKLWIKWKDVPLDLYHNGPEWDEILKEECRIREAFPQDESRVAPVVWFFIEELQSRAEERNKK